MAAVTADEAFDIAISFHSAGRLAEAEEVFLQLVTQQPQHWAAIHGLGVIALQTGREALAVEFLRRAIAMQPQCAEAYGNLGCALRNLGRREESAEAFRAAIALNPALVEFHSNLGNVLRELGKLDEAIAACERAIAIDPHDAAAWNNLGVALRDKADCEHSINACQRAVALAPDFAAAHYNLGNALGDAGRVSESIDAFRRAVQIRPDYAAAWGNLGSALGIEGFLDEALAACQTALSLDRRSADAHCNLGDILQRAGNVDAAIIAYSACIALEPAHSAAHNNLGNALTLSKRIPEAISSYRQALSLSPASATLANLGAALLIVGEIDQAISACQEAVQLAPASCKALTGLGNAFKAGFRLDEAIAAYTQAVAADGSAAAVHNNLGSALADAGDLDQAIAAFRGAIEVDPGYRLAYENLIYTLHFHPQCDAASIAAEQRRWSCTFAEPLKKLIRPHRNVRDPGRRLRVGYVSPNFFGQAEAHFILPLLENHDHQGFEIHLYSSTQKADVVTRLHRRFADRWHEVADLNDAELAARIRDDGIDLLVDPVMHMSGCRLLTFARKPAPVQVSWLAYPGGTGLETIDYRLTDHYLDPPGSADAQHTERPFPLPAWWACYKPISEVCPAPLRPIGWKGPICFGSLNAPAKMNTPTVQLWSRVLKAVPDSRVLLLSTSSVQENRLRLQFEEAGIAVSRVEFINRSSREHYLPVYHRIDIALDPLPYNGITTTLDSLWMGIPVVSLAGTRAAGRAGLGILTTLGLPELAVRTPDDFVAAAVSLAGDRERQRQLRSTLRHRMEGSLLMNGKYFAGEVEAAYRKMWQNWCESGATLAE